MMDPSPIADGPRKQAGKRCGCVPLCDHYLYRTSLYIYLSHIMRSINCSIDAFDMLDIYRGVYAHDDA